MSYQETDKGEGVWEVHGQHDPSDLLAAFIAKHKNLRITAMHLHQWETGIFGGDNVVHKFWILVTEARPQPRKPRP